ncbi:protein of unknown function [Nitrospira defluvii]|uniref:Uncharacterized protein n=1 Tax=Nitrospira defluvii TaxID=330214 RepID=D8P9R0_9BACT|nr:protein of unknown function [Nitrospira defluvii]
MKALRYQCEAHGVLLGVLRRLVANCYTIVDNLLREMVGRVANIKDLREFGAVSTLPASAPHTVCSPRSLSRSFLATG